MNNMNCISVVKRLSLFSLVLLMTTASCKKKNDGPKVETIAINGADYPISRIGSQAWTTVNYNGSGGINYNEGNNEPSFGKLYTREEALAIVLPAGWRLPTKVDFEKLVNNYPHEKGDDYTELLSEGVLQMMSVSGWQFINGNNASGFNGLPAGTAYIDAGGNNDFRYRGIETIFISSTTRSVTNGGTVRPATWGLYLHSEVTSGEQEYTDISGGVYEVLNSDWYRYSVRFVKDLN